MLSKDPILLEIYKDRMRQSFTKSLSLFFFFSQFYNLSDPEITIMLKAASERTHEPMSYDRHRE